LLKSPRTRRSRSRRGIARSKSAAVSSLISSFIASDLPFARRTPLPRSALPCERRDADHILPRFCVRHRDHTFRDGADGKEPVLVLTVLLVIDHEVVGVALEEDPDLIEAET